MHRAHFFPSLLLVGLLAACGGSSNSPDAGSPDAADAAGTVVIPGLDAGSAGGDAGSPDVSHRLSVSATPITVNQVVTALDEGPVVGSIMITRGSEHVEDAVVTLNGTPIPHSFSGLYNVAASGVSGLGPGSTVTIVATTTDPPDSRTLQFTCPVAITFSSPPENTVVQPEQILSVSWAPGIPFDAPRIAGGPILGFFAGFTEMSGNEVSFAGHGQEFISLEVGQTSQDIAVPPGGPIKRYLLELQWPGERTLQAEGTDILYGYCAVRNRLWLLGP